MQHSYRFLIPNLLISKDKKIYLPEKYSDKISVFVYDAHQHFYDIRGRTK